MPKLGFSVLLLSGLTLAMSVSPTFANDIDDRVNFFLSQPNSVSLRANVRRAPGINSDEVPLMFRIPSHVRTSVHTRHAPKSDLRLGNAGLSILSDDMPALRQYPVASIYQDPTLRKGDIVVTNTGIQVFRGRESDSHRRADFVRWQPSQSSKLERANLSALAKVIEPASATQSVTKPVIQAASHAIPLATRSVDQAMVPMRKIETNTASQTLTETTLR